MSMYKFNLHKPLSLLEQKKNRRYSYAEIADISSLTRQGVRRLLKESTETLNISTLNKLLNFFRNEGMQISVNDVFEYTPDPSYTLDIHSASQSHTAENVGLKAG